MDTPFRPLFKVPWFGDGTSDHCDPSNCTISVRFTRSASPASPTAHHSSADTKEASVNSPPETGAATRLSEPHVEAAVRPVPAPRAPDTTSQPGQVLAAVAAAPAAATPATKLRRDTGAGLCPPCSRSCSLALSATAPPKNAHERGRWNLACEQDAETIVALAKLPVHMAVPSVAPTIQISLRKQLAIKPRLGAVPERC